MTKSKTKKILKNEQGLIPLLIVLVGALVLVIAVAYIRVHKAQH